MSSRRKMNKMLKQQNLTLEPVFQLKIMGEDRVMCKYLHQIADRSQLYDDPIELKEQNGILDLGTNGKYEIVGRACHCRIPGAFLIKNKKLPVYYISIVYSSQLVRGSMFNFFCHFNIGAEDAKILLLPKQYVNKLIHGKFTMEIMDAEGFLTWFIHKKRPIIEENVMLEYVDKFDLATSDEEKEQITSEIKLESEKRLDVYRNIFETIELEGYLTQKKIFNKMIEIMKTPIFKELTESCLEYTQLERAKKMGVTSSALTVPKNVLKLDQFVEDPSKLDEYLNLNSDSEEYDDEDVYEEETI